MSAAARKNEEVTAEVQSSKFKVQSAWDRKNPAPGNQRLVASDHYDYDWIRNVEKLKLYSQVVAQVHVVSCVSWLKKIKV